MINMQKKEKCSGCEACANACPKQAIRMEFDEEGFLFPVINEDKCTGCQVCVGVCPIDKKIKECNDIKIAYVAKNKSNEVRLNSASGGIASELMKMIVSSRGYICGAVMEKNMKVIHKLSDCVIDIEKIRRTKYVQSSIGDIFKRIKHLLIDNKKVLLIGTPCQVHGLKSFLGKEYENLYTVDLLCKGVPSPIVWEKYVTYIEQQYGGSLIDCNFRSKNRPNNATCMSYTFENSKISRLHGEDSYMLAFFRNMSLRLSCYQCKYKSYSRTGDLTIGDYRGEDIPGGFVSDGYGQSTVLVNTYKGLWLWNSIKNNVEYSETDFESIRQPCLCESDKLPPIRKIFIRDVLSKGFEEMRKKYHI